jgi:phosphatidylglycerophosphatase A
VECRRRTRIKRTAITLATWFGCGRAPVAPGTFGAAGALAVAYVLNRSFGWSGPALSALGILFLWPGVWSADVAAREGRSKDPGFVVIDEVIGQWIALAGATTLNWKSWLGAFLLFRVFDIWKPAPVRQLERLRGGLGIVADDVMAGAYAALVLFLAGCFNLY